jgi:serine/threonine protein kinase
MFRRWRTDDAWYLKHDKSILHLDLKPGNVLLTWDEGRLM